MNIPEGGNADSTYLNSKILHLLKYFINSNVTWSMQKSIQETEQNALLKGGSRQNGAERVLTSDLLLAHLWSIRWIENSGSTDLRASSYMVHTDYISRATANIEKVKDFALNCLDQYLSAFPHQNSIFWLNSGLNSIFKLFAP